MESTGLSDQIVVVTGAGRGLGRAVAAAFAREGARVVALYRRSVEGAESLVAEYGADRVFPVQADVTDPDRLVEAVRLAGEHFGAPVTVLVNNALVDFVFNGDGRAKADEIRWEDFRAQLEGSLAGALNAIHAVLPDLRRAGGGAVVNIGTNLFQNPVVPYHDYTASKAALLSLTRTFAADLGPEQITVNMVSGGLLRTTDASAATPPEVFDAIAQGTPLRRVTTPEEMADAVLFFASRWARSVTGQNLVVDGGLVMN